MLNVTIEDTRGVVIIRGRLKAVLMDSNNHITYTVDRVTSPGRVCPLDIFEP